MGERLNIEIMKDDDVVANAYYHWGAYSTEALRLAHAIVQKDKELKDETITDEIAHAITLLRATGAALTENEHTLARNQKHIDDAFDASKVNRNDGLISISEKGILNTENWAGMTVTIHLNDQYHVEAPHINEFFIDYSMGEYRQYVHDQYIEPLSADDKEEINKAIENVCYNENLIDIVPTKTLGDLDKDEFGELISQLNNVQDFYTKQDKSEIAMQI